MSYSLNALYLSVGISKQAVQQFHHRKAVQQNQAIELFNIVDIERNDCGGIGIRALYDKIKPKWIGRDRFEMLLTENGYKVKKTRALHRTTRSGKNIYPNLIEGMVLLDSWEVWQSDTTYYRIGENHYYITLIEDIYDRYIVGYAVHDNLRTEANLAALEMAFKAKQRISGSFRIHHSDRGSQYGSEAYTKRLNEKFVFISMGKSGPDNAYVERLHGTIKNQYLYYWKPTCLTELKKCVAKAIKHYNEQRQHTSLANNSPMQFNRLDQTIRMNNVHIIHSPVKNLDRYSPLDNNDELISGPYCRITLV
jgi:putative transposase